MNEQIKIVLNAFDNGVSIPLIANITNLSTEKVKEILGNFKKL